MKKLLALLMLVWVVKGFKSMDSMVEFLNQLSPEQAAAAKIMTGATNRTTWMGDNYFMVYPTDKKGS